MYVLMPVSWTYHPFFKSQFLLTSENQIRKMIGAGMKEVRVDFSKSQIVDEVPEPVVVTPEKPKKRSGAEGIAGDDL
jgi:hypothetical protein